MENASKALIIAGAILLSILIIGLGMTIYQKASGAMNGADLGGTQVQTYNAEFLQYTDTQTGANARALLQLIQNHNRSNQDDPSKQISYVINTTAVAKATAVSTATTGDAIKPFEAPEDGAATTGALNDIKAGYTYYVYFQYSKTGYITKCTITRVKAE